MIIFILMVLIAVGVVWWLYEDKMKQIQSILDKTGYIHEREKFMKVAFQGTPYLQRVEGSSSLVDEFKTSKYVELLIKYFNMNMDSKSLDSLMRLEIATKKLYKEAAAQNISPKYFDNKIPTFTISCSKGNVQKENCVCLNCETIKDMKIKMKKLLVNRSALEFQEQKITPELRNRILRRDNYTCQCCGNSIQTEPNLALKVDYIVPIRKGGKAVPSNLQTLCWICSKEKK